MLEIFKAFVNTRSWLTTILKPVTIMTKYLIKTIDKLDRKLSCHFQRDQYQLLQSIYSRIFAIINKILCKIKEEWIKSKSQTGPYLLYNIGHNIYICFYDSTDWLKAWTSARDVWRFRLYLNVKQKLI